VSSAQTTGTLTGTITNATGASVPTAAITVTPISGGAPQRVVAGPDGTFTITGLPPGAYRVDVEFSGYKRSSIQTIDLVAGNSAQIRVELQQGDTRETVEVQGSAVLIQTDKAEMSKALDRRTVSEIPLYDRNHEQLAVLLPGITPPRTTESLLADPQRSRIWETNGLFNNANRRTLDGVENEEPFNRIGLYNSPVDSVQEVDLATSNYDARLGRAGGTIINPVTRSGSNGLHGSLFEFNSNNAMSARNYFNPSPLPQARYTSNQFGASAGGAMKRDTTFFMLSYEGDFNREQRPTVTTVPTADIAAGNFSAVPGLTLYDPRSGSLNGSGRTPISGNMLQPNQISPVARNFLSYFPAPNAAGFENNLFVNVPMRNDGNRGDFRLDHKMGDNTNLFLRWSYANFVTEEGSPLGILGGGNGHLRNHNAMIGATHTFSSSTTTDLRFSYARYANRLNSSAGVSPSSLGFTDPNSSSFLNAGFGNLGLPSIQIAGMQSFGMQPTYPQSNVDNTLNLVNGWTHVTGHNTFRAGFDVWGIQSNGFQNYAFGPNGGYIFGNGATASATGAGLGPYGSYANSFAAFLLGAPTQVGRTLPAMTPSYNSVQGSVYLGDAFKATERLTLDLGVRWDVFSPLTPRRNQGVSIYNPTTNQLLPTDTGSVDNAGNVQTNWKNIGPRIGIAYRPMERTVIRAGYAITYFQGPLNFYAASLISNPTVTTGIAGGFSTVPGTFGILPSATINGTGGTNPIAAPNSTMYFTPSDIRTPYVQQFDFLIEQDLGRYGLVGTIGYVGNLGRHLPYSLDLNTAAAGAGVAGLPFNTTFGRTAGVIETGTGLTSNYNSLQATLTKRFGQSLSFTAAYTYGKAMDYGAGGLTPLLNNLNLRSNYGPADWDRTHMFSLSHVWQIPIGANTNFLSQGWIGRILGPWQIAGMFNWVSGTPLNLTADPTLCNCLGNTPTASQVVNGVTTGFIPVPTFYGFLPVPYAELNFAYAQPDANSLGNLGRNAVRGPGFANYNMSLSRSFVIHEQARFQISGEAYNLANTAHFSNPITNVSSANFGQSTSTLPYAAERRLQVAAKILF